MKKNKELENTLGFLLNELKGKNKKELMNFYYQVVDWLEKNDINAKYNLMIFLVIKDIYNVYINKLIIKDEFSNPIKLEIFEVYDICEKLKQFIVDEMPILNKYFIDYQINCIKKNVDIETISRVLFISNYVRNYKGHFIYKHI